MRIRTGHTFLSLLGVLLLAAGACGGGDSADDGATAARTVEVEMRDIHYEPATVSVRAGETVKFVFRNVGDAVHDAFIGDEAAQAEHEKEMREGGSKHHGGDDHAVTVEPGKTASLTYTFKGGETLLIGCHQPAHYQAGMKVTLTVG
jgi:uncharacterized cupredoxin-like copper-binding protein